MDDVHRLLGDLDAQLLAAERVELDGEVADRIRHEYAAVPLADRVRASAGATVLIGVRGRDRVRGRLEMAGPDWFMVQEPAGPALVALAAVLTVAGVRDGVRPVVGAVAERFALPLMLRKFATERAEVTLTLVDGGRLRGGIGQVGRDHLELHTSDVSVRPPIQLVATAGIAVVRLA